LRSYRGATGTEPIDLSCDLPIDGCIEALIPVSVQQVIALWEAGGLPKDHPKSGWHQIPNFAEFKLDVRAYKAKFSLFGSTQWVARVGFWFGNLKSPITIENIGFLRTGTIAEIFLEIDKLLKGDWILLKANEALSH
jgi:hypothetical protein